MKPWEMIGWLPKWPNREPPGNQSSKFTLLGCKRFENQKQRLRRNLYASVGDSTLTIAYGWATRECQQSSTQSAACPCKGPAFSLSEEQKLYPCHNRNRSENSLLSVISQVRKDTMGYCFHDAAETGKMMETEN